MKIDSDDILKKHEIGIKLRPRDYVCHSRIVRTETRRNNKCPPSIRMSNTLEKISKNNYNRCKRNRYNITRNSDIVLNEK